MLKFLLGVLFLVSSLLSSEIVIASGAGYKRPVNELIAKYQELSGEKINAIYGNMQQISEQIKHSDKISIFIGDESFIKKLGIKHTDRSEMGKGALMLVFVKPNQSVESLKDADVKKIGIPDLKKAVYRKAGSEFLKSSKLDEKLKDKLVVLQTVPQVSSYLLSGDIDAGFINKTDYLGIKDKVGTAIEIDGKLSNPIKILAVQIEGRDTKESKKLLEFLSSKEAREILVKYGL